MTKESEEGIAVDERKFAEGGILVASILGGFTFAGLVLVLQSQPAIEVNLARNLPRVVVGTNATGIWFPIVYGGFGGLSILCLITSVLFLIVASAKNLDSVLNLFEFAQKSLLGAIGAFGSLVGWLVLGFTISGGSIVIIVGIVYWFFIASPAWRKAERKDRKARANVKK